jgi:hypothetical protein
MTAEEAARTIGLDLPVYLALLTETTRREYEASGLLHSSFTDLSVEQKISLITDERAQKARKNKSYYERNRERLCCQHTCTECGGKYTMMSKSRHTQSKKHIHALSLT